MPDPDVSYFTGRDGLRLAYRELGAGRPLVLLHGFMGDAGLWLRHGHAEAMAARGYRVIMPDLRGHGASGRPRDPARYPRDVLADDGLALVDQLGLDDYDLAGYSLGARVVVRMLARGASPGRAVVAGQGLRQVLGLGEGAGALLRRVVAGPRPLPPGTPEERTERWLRSSGADPVALLHVLDSLVPTPVEELGAIRVPTLVAVGDADERADTAGELAEALPRGSRAVLPGDHGTAPVTAAYTEVVAGFLAGR